MLRSRSSQDMEMVQTEPRVVFMEYVFVDNKLVLSVDTGASKVFYYMMKGCSIEVQNDSVARKCCSTSCARDSVHSWRDQVAQTTQTVI